MMFPAGHELGAYRIEQKIGEGGMGVVYAAVDTRLERRVALKVLPAAVAGDQRRLERFEREAKTIALLNHPNIVTVHSIEEEDGIRFITMELVEGKSLSELIPEDGMELARLFEVGIPLAEALHAAHEGGVIHRDLKPANVMVTDDGRVKVLDFGLAKLGELPGAEATQGDVEASSEGMLVGSAPYMSPEQAEGRPVDHRSDLFSLGAVLSEMVTGRRLFAADTVVETLFAVINEDPQSLSELRPEMPRQLARIIGHCLVKNRRRRCQSALTVVTSLADLRQDVELGDALSGTVGMPVSRSRSGQRWMGVIGLLVGAGMVVITTWLAGWWPAPDRGLVAGSTRRLTHTPGAETFPALSPDGKMVAFVAGPPGDRRVMVRHVAGGRAIELSEGLEAKEWEWPRWSPDGSKIMFASWGGSARIYVVPALGGRVELVADLPDYFTCAAWSPDGQAFAFVHGGAIRIRDVDDRGLGRVVAESESPHFLTFSPDGQRLAWTEGNRRYVTFGNVAPSSLWVVAIDSGLKSEITPATSLNVSPVWTADSRSLLFVSDRDGTNDVFQVTIDDAGQADGQPRRVTTGLNPTSIALAAGDSVMAYSLVGHSANVNALPVDAGSEFAVGKARPVTEGRQIVEALDVSVDGRWLAYDSNLAGHQDIYRLVLPTGEPERLTDHPADDWGPVISPDGTEIAFYSLRSGNRDLYVMDADGRGEPLRVSSGVGTERYPSWSPDGHRLAFDCPENESISIIERGPSGWGEPILLIDGVGFPRAARWSPVAELVLVPTSTAIELVDVSDRSIRTLSRRADPTVPVPWAVAWSPNGDEIYVKAIDPDGAQRIRQLYLDGREPRIVVEFDRPLPRSVGPDFDFDGANFYLTLPETDGDLWLMEMGQGKSRMKDEG